MRFEGAGCTDVGRVKETNQDSYLVKIAETDLGDVALVAVADGMGGLAKGELASATAIRTLSEWFEQKLPPSLEAMDTSVSGFERFVEGQWNGLVQDLNLEIMRYGMRDKINLGTTLTAMLAIGARYSIVHVGDSRAYEIAGNSVTQLTEDQTFVRREIDAGRMTPEEALTHPQRNVLLQCLGASKEVTPEIIHGNLKREATYLLCSDGFRHVLTDEDLRGLSLAAIRAHVAGDATTGPAAAGVAAAAPSAAAPATGMTEIESKAAHLLADMTKLVMDRKERDNITAVVLTVEEGGR